MSAITVPGTQLVPVDQYYDEVTKEWLLYETPNTDVRRRSWTTEKPTIAVLVYHGEVHILPVSQSLNPQAVDRKDRVYGYVERYLFEQKGP